MSSLQREHEESPLFELANEYKDHKASREDYEGEHDEYCEYCGNSWLLHYGGKECGSRRIGIEYQYDHPGRYDGVSEWRCPDCGVRTNRFTGDRLDDDQYASWDGNKRYTDD